MTFSPENEGHTRSGKEDCHYFNKENIEGTEYVFKYNSPDFKGGGILVGEVIESLGYPYNGNETNIRFIASEKEFVRIKPMLELPASKLEVEASSVSQ